MDLRVVRILDRLQRASFMPSLSAGFPLAAVSSFSLSLAFVRTGPVRFFQAIGRGGLAAIAAVLGLLLLHLLQAFPQRLVFRREFSKFLKHRFQPRMINRCPLLNIHGTTPGGSFCAEDTHKHP